MLEYNWEEWIRTLPRGGMYRKIHPPRPKRFPKGRGVQNPRTREISRAEGGVFSDTSLLSNLTHTVQMSQPVYPSFYEDNSIYILHLTQKSSFTPAFNLLISNFYQLQGATVWLAFGECKIITRSFHRARFCKFLQQKLCFFTIQLRKYWSFLAAIVLFML